jgi:hypothetical protein
MTKDIAELIAGLNETVEVAVSKTCPRGHPMFEKWDATVRRDPWLTNRRPSLSPIEKRRRRIVFALSREIEKRKGRLTALDKRRFKLEFGKDDVCFTLREPKNKIQRPLTEQERRWWPDQRFKSDLEPSNKLRLLIESYFDRPIQKNWTDLEGKPLEGRLRDVLIGLFIALSENRRRRLVREEEAQCRARREEECREAEERRRAEQARLQKLNDEAAGWIKANQIREYVAARLESAKQNGSIDLVETWAKWAAAAADSMDPLFHHANVEDLQAKSNI